MQQQILGMAQGQKVSALQEWGHELDPKHANLNSSGSVVWDSTLQVFNIWVCATPRKLHNQTMQSLHPAIITTITKVVKGAKLNKYCVNSLLTFYFTDIGEFVSFF